MDVTVDLGAVRPFVLNRAVLLYDEQNGERAFASVHDVAVPRAGARPVLGAGKPVTRAFIRSLVSSLGQELSCEFIPSRVLYRTHDVLAWWSPAQTRTLFFRKGSELGELDAEDFPIPALVWCVTNAGLFLRALVKPERPEPETALYVAPFWNTSPSGGGVCQGTMARPEERSVGSLGAWEDGFFRAQFTHHYGGGSLTAHPRGHVGLWKSLAGSKRPFPVRHLVAVPGETLNTFVLRSARNGLA